MIFRSELSLEDVFADLPDGLAGLWGFQGTGVLRSKPNIHWRKGRGKEPHQPQDQFPWFWRDGEFTAERVNDVPLPPAEKQAERIHVDEPRWSIA